MWAQEWTNIFDLVAPYPEVTSVDVTSLLRNANYSVVRMFREADSFFTSLGLEPMTADFWNKSMFVRPSDGRQVACHGSAHDLFKETDFRYDIVGHIVVVVVVVDDDAFTKFKRKCYLFKKFTLRTCNNMTKTIVFTLQE